MTAYSPTHKTAKLLVAVMIAVIAVYLLWVVGSALILQYKLLGGCWPEWVILDGQTVPPETLISYHAEMRGLGGLMELFFSTARHRILHYLMPVCAILGWSGWFLLKFHTSEPNSAPPLAQIPSWKSMLGLLTLSVMAGIILSGLFVGGRLIMDRGGEGCIYEGYVYFAAVASIGSGLFVVKFFKWFESITDFLWEKLFRHH